MPTTTTARQQQDGGQGYEPPPPRVGAASGVEEELLEGPLLDRMDEWMLQVLLFVYQPILFLGRLLARMVGVILLGIIRLSVKCHPLRDDFDWLLWSGNDNTPGNLSEDAAVDDFIRQFPLDDDAQQDRQYNRDSVSDLPLDPLELQMPALPPVAQARSATTSAAVIEEEPSSSNTSNNNMGPPAPLAAANHHNHNHTNETLSYRPFAARPPSPQLPHHRYPYNAQAQLEYYTLRQQYQQQHRLKDPPPPPPPEEEDNYETALEREYLQDRAARKARKKEKKRRKKQKRREKKERKRAKKRARDQMGSRKGRGIPEIVYRLSGDEEENPSAASLKQQQQQQDGNWLRMRDTNSSDEEEDERPAQKKKKGQPKADNSSTSDEDVDDDDDGEEEYQHSQKKRIVSSSRSVSSQRSGGSQKSSVSQLTATSRRSAASGTTAGSQKSAGSRRSTASGAKKRRSTSAASTKKAANKRNAKKKRKIGFSEDDSASSDDDDAMSTKSTKSAASRRSTRSAKSEASSQGSTKSATSRGSVASSRRGRKKKEDSESSDSDSSDSSSSDEEDGGVPTYRKLPTCVEEIPPSYVERFLSVGFAPWNRKVLPCMIVSPFDFIDGSRFQRVWMSSARKFLRDHGSLENDSMPLFVYWFTDKTYAMIPAEKFVPYSEADDKWKEIPHGMLRKLELGKTLTDSESLYLEGLQEASEFAKNSDMTRRTHPQLEKLRASQRTRSGKARLKEGRGSHV